MKHKKIVAGIALAVMIVLVLSLLLLKPASSPTTPATTNPILATHSSTVSTITSTNSTASSTSTTVTTTVSTTVPTTVLTTVPTTVPTTVSTTIPTTVPSTTITTMPSSQPTTPIQPVLLPLADKETIIAFYAAAANRVKNDAAADYTKKVWQEITDVNLGSDIANNTANNTAKLFMKTEDNPTITNYPRGEEKSIEKFPGWTLTDLDKVISATCTVTEGGNYKIVIVMEDEDTPVEGSSFLEQVTSTLMFWGTLEETLNGTLMKNVLNKYEDIHIIFRNFTIEAEITPDGKFVYLDHTADVDVTIGYAKILNFYTIENGSGHMWNFSKFYDFVY